MCVNFCATLLMKNLTIVECEYDDLCSIFFHEKRKLCSLPLKRKGLTIIFQLEFTSTLHIEQNNFQKETDFIFLF